MAKKNMKYGVLIFMAIVATLLWMNSIQPTNATVMSYGTLRKWTGLSTDTKPTASATGARQGDEFIELDTGRTFVHNGTTWILKGTITTSSDSTSMTAPGNSAAISTVGYSKGGYLFDINSINTSVTLTLQGLTNDSGWTSIGTDSLVYTVNDYEGLLTRNASLYDSLRLKWISEAGGTAALVTYTSVLGGQ